MRAIFLSLYARQRDEPGFSSKKLRSRAMALGAGVVDSQLRVFFRARAATKLRSEILFSIRADSAEKNRALVTIAKRVYHVPLAAELPDQSVSVPPTARKVLTSGGGTGTMQVASRFRSRSKIQCRSNQSQPGQVDNPVTDRGKSAVMTRESLLIHKCG